MPFGSHQPATARMPRCADIVFCGTLSWWAVGNDPDSAFYYTAHHRAAIMNAKSGTVSVIDVAARKVVRTIVLKPGLEFAQAGPATRCSSTTRTLTRSRPQT